MFSKLPRIPKSSAPLTATDEYRYRHRRPRGSSHLNPLHDFNKSKALQKLDVVNLSAHVQNHDELWRSHHRVGNFFLSITCLFSMAIYPPSFKNIRLIISRDEPAIWAISCCVNLAVMSFPSRLASLLMKDQVVRIIGKDNTFIARLIRTIRHDFPGQALFCGTDGSGIKLVNFQIYYNQHRTHSPLWGDTPVEVDAVLPICPSRWITSVGKLTVENSITFAQRLE